MKISIKLGLWFFVCILIIETSSMMYLHRNIVHSRVHQELESLKARGNSHRDVLEISSDPSTLHHIGLMESQTDTEVVITKTNGEMIETSRNIDESIKEIINRPLRSIPNEGLILESDWKKEKYISTVSLFKDENGNSGYVYMFKSTDQVKNFISQLNKHFLLASLLILFFMIVTIFFLSKALTKPLIKMKEATKNLSNGDFSVSLPVKSNDELGELSNSIQTLASDLKYMKQERDDFLASISHELRTPLTYIKGYSDIGRKPTLNEKERIHYLDIIHEESERINLLLQELFELATLDQNTFSVVKERVHLCSFFKSIYEKVSPAFKEKEIQLNVECDEQLFLPLDITRFGQVLLNLLDNALKYSKEKTITQINVNKIEGNIYIDITDQGMGIPKDDIPYIFERLYRVEKSRSRTTGGFGMGLAIVKQLVEAHGGQITVKSKVGEGTVFTIVLREE
ncbi:ATP-binding protein [Cytobacillus sp. FJAT-53684]|uniref:histidine kinase n=1 Tax=Cytobacillus mangrovibacter TaxID=3299024 RepID=A0ABW6K5T3_9BACI